MLPKHARTDGVDGLEQLARVLRLAEVVRAAKVGHCREEGQLVTVEKE
jgi:hypothetical protein